MFQTFTDLFIIFIGYPTCLLSLWAVCDYLENNNPKGLIIMTLIYFFFFSLFIFTALA